MEKEQMVYFDIHNLENILEEVDLKTKLALLDENIIKEKLANYIKVPTGMVYNQYEDKCDKLSEDGLISYRGLFVVISHKKLVKFKLAVLLTDFLKNNPHIKRGVAEESNTIATAPEEDVLPKMPSTSTEQRLFGVLDDYNHISYLREIKDVDIIQNVGDFKKVYFSIPIHQKNNVLALSVTLLNQIKCKRALQDFII